MSDITFNKEKLVEVSNYFSTFNRELSTAKEIVVSEINTIYDNWSGEEFESAKLELDKIITYLDSISSEISQVNSLLSATSDGFNAIKYNG